MDEMIETSPVYHALMKRNTLWGVEYHYALCEIILVFILFINTHSFWVFFFIIPLHIVGIILNYQDPHLIPIILTKPSARVAKNKAHWECESYGEW